MPEFLASHFQKVRYKAVDVLVGVLNSSVRSTKIKTIHRMEELFDSMFNWVNLPVSSLSILLII